MWEVELAGLEISSICGKLKISSKVASADLFSNQSAPGTIWILKSSFPHCSGFPFQKVNSLLCVRNSSANGV